MTVIMMVIRTAILTGGERYSMMSPTAVISYGTKGTIDVVDVNVWVLSLTVAQPIAYRRLTSYPAISLCSEKPTRDIATAYVQPGLSDPFWVSISGNMKGARSGLNLCSHLLLLADVLSPEFRGRYACYSLIARYSTWRTVGVEGRPSKGTRCYHPGYR